MAFWQYTAPGRLGNGRAIVKVLPGNVLAGLTLNMMKRGLASKGDAALR